MTVALLGLLNISILFELFGLLKLVIQVWIKSTCNQKHKFANYKNYEDYVTKVHKLQDASS